MDKKLYTKIWALMGYTLGIIIIQSIFASKLENWLWILVGIFLILLNLFHVLTLLDIKIRVPISRKWYYVLLVTFTTGLLILFIKIL